MRTAIMRERKALSMQSPGPAGATWAPLTSIFLRARFPNGTWFTGATLGGIAMRTNRAEVVIQFRVKPDSHINMRQRSRNLSCGIARSSLVPTLRRLRSEIRGACFTSTSFRPLRIMSIWSSKWSFTAAGALVTGYHSYLRKLPCYLATSCNLSSAKARATRAVQQAAQYQLVK